ncbi:MAG: MBL fold metallo-hydrolase [Candidatus Rickettsia vulgarisii]
MDIATIKKLWKRDRPKIITPLMNDLTLKNNIPGIEVTTMDWEDKISIKDNVSISLEAAQHWSARGIFDKNKALWGTFLITTSVGTICFIGDTGYNSKIFKKIGNKYNVLVSLIPIGFL